MILTILQAQHRHVPIAWYCERTSNVHAELVVNFLVSNDSCACGIIDRHISNRCTFAHIKRVAEGAAVTPFLYLALHSAPNATIMLLILRMAIASIECVRILFL